MASALRHAENVDPARSAALRAVAEEAARKVQAPLLAAFRSAMDIDYKVDLHDLVTVHDKQSEQTIRDLIFARVPDSTFMGEEGGSVGDGPVCWYVDPIDGTSNFARGIAFWCVSIAAVIDGEIVAGVIYDPVADNMFAADITGVWLNGAPLRSRAIAEETRATLITGYPVARDFRLDGKAEALEHFGVLAETFSTLRRPGSAALSLAHVAAGWTDAAAGFGVNPWDVTAGVLILRQAGGSYRALTLGKVAPDTPDFFCPGYVATGEGADYPTLDSVANSIDGHRNRTLKRP
ncbi:inositol phosphatase [Devosia limi DSM 17137]|uniref:Inositol-1-monophosphatase n=1 Tax=Devosia limi DSM 17137 TaxID=1121477 RepID=A0A0F5LUH5_9HYPH|nr:inositol monophosphatase family protein [Devosia limi]KKB85941.1 inositol phosphatase [Devosia limi DSM 17137]SHF01232.1 myo-inositol-1(or 4)-monophosphatase [Devosia limi DSM 17137]